MIDNRYVLCLTIHTKSIPNQTLFFKKYINLFECKNDLLFFYVILPKH